MSATAEKVRHGSTSLLKERIYVLCTPYSTCMLCILLCRLQYKTSMEYLYTCIEPKCNTLSIRSTLQLTLHPLMSVRLSAVLLLACRPSLPYQASLFNFTRTDYVRFICRSPYHTYVHTEYWTLVSKSPMAHHQHEERGRGC